VGAILKSQDHRSANLIRTSGDSDLLNERKEFMQEAQHTKQTATRTAQNQDMETT